MSAWFLSSVHSLIEQPSGPRGPAAHIARISRNRYHTQNGNGIHVRLSHDARRRAIGRAIDYKVLFYFRPTRAPSSRDMALPRNA